jgi:hypothetical protein
MTGYMLALAHQSQEGFSVWVVEPGREVREHYYTSLSDMVRASWSVRKTRDFHPESRRTASLDSHRTFFPTSNFADTIRCCD